MKKGFTLIELLAVIVILAIIALIAIPTISGLIEKARLGAVRDSVYNMIDAAELHYAMNDSDSVNGSLTFTCDGSKCTTSSGQVLKFKGKVPSVGEISASKDNSNVFNLTIGNYCAIGSKNDLTVVKGDCAGLYDSNNKRIATWDELVDKYHVSVEEDFITDEMANLSPGTNLPDNNGYWEYNSEQHKGRIFSQYDKHGYESLGYVIESNEKFADVSKIILPNGIKKIGNAALAGLNSDESRFIGCMAFGADSKVTNILIPSTVKKIGAYALAYNVNLEELIIPEGVEEIGNNALNFSANGYNTKMKKLYIPSTLKIYGKNNEQFYSLNELYLGAQLGDNVSFSPSVLKKLYLYDASYFEKNFNRNVPRGTNLVELKIVSGKIDNYMFAGSSNLTNVEFGNNVTEIGTGAFIYSKIKEVKINAFKIGQNSFSNNLIEKLELGSNVEEIGATAFVSNKLKELKIDAKTIGYAAFASNKIKKLIIGKNVKTISQVVFASNPLEEVEFEKKTGWNVSGTKILFNEDGTCKRDSNEKCLTETVDIKNIDLSDSKQNAKYLSSEYSNCTWTNES